MTNLEIAKNTQAIANGYWDRYFNGNPDDRGNPYQRGEAERNEAGAMLYAAIAQAEAQTRIAECLETLIEALSPDIKQHAADLSEELEQAQTEWLWTDHENDRLRAENDKLRRRINELEARRLGETVENGDGESWGDDLRAARKQVQEWAEAERRRLGIA